MTAAGTIEVARIYLVCQGCGAGGHVADEVLGIDGSVAPGAQRMMTLAAANGSFQQAADTLRELAGIAVCDNTVRAVALAHGRKMREWQRISAAPAEAFARAEGEVDLTVDGATVNTTEGWREVRLGVITKRRPGAPTLPSQWVSRYLPEPGARLAFGGIWNSDRFGSMWRPWLARVGVRDTQEVSLEADGAKWIWLKAESELPGSQGVLDIYHALEHVHECARALYGDGAGEAKAWAEQQTNTLLAKGSEALRAELTEQRKRLRAPAKRSALRALDQYLAPHAKRTDYAGRLAAGRTIGSGVVEGACETVVGQRLKRTGARWRIRNVESMLAVCCVRYGRLWDAYWSAAA